MLKPHKERDNADEDTQHKNANIEDEHNTETRLDITHI